MEITIKIDERNKEAKALVAYLRNLPFVTVSKEETFVVESDEKLTKQQTEWINRLKESAKDVKNNDKSKFRPIQSLLNEL